jgi:peptide subunit release factor 1 (eRF1)
MYKLVCQKCGRIFESKNPRKACTKCGNMPSGAKPRLDYDEIIEALDDPLATITQIADDFDTSKQRVSQISKEAGFKSYRLSPRKAAILFGEK